MTNLNFCETHVTLHNNQLLLGDATLSDRYWLVSSLFLAFSVGIEMSHCKISPPMTSHTCPMITDEWKSFLCAKHRTKGELLLHSSQCPWGDLIIWWHCSVLLIYWEIRQKEGDLLRVTHVRDGKKVQKQPMGIHTIGKVRGHCFSIERSHSADRLRYWWGDRTHFRKELVLMAWM